MRDTSEIESRVQLLLQQELARRLLVEQEPSPSNCKYHHQQPLDYRKVAEGDPNPHYNRIGVEGLPVIQTLGICLHGSQDPSEWKGTICEELVDAQNCARKLSGWPGAFTPKQTPREVYDQFVRDVSDERWVMVNLPRVHPLLWVLGTAVRVVPSVPKPNWRQRFLSWLCLMLWSLNQTRETEVSVHVTAYLPPPPDENYSS